MWWGNLLALVCAPLVVALYEEKFNAAYDSVLEKKCEGLRLKFRAAFIGDRCFAATKTKFKKPLSNWNDLHRECTHIDGYRAHMAHIFCEKQLDELLAAEVLENSMRYYVGARQSPTDDEKRIPCCSNKEEHAKRWSYFDETGASVGELNANLWLKDQPDNSGGQPPEFVVTLEKLDGLTHKLGFNDANPNDQEYYVLCEYEDYLKCPKGWTLIGEKCYKVISDKQTYNQARSTCARQDGTNGVLAAIHDDDLNRRIVQLAQATFGPQSMEPYGDLAHNPVLFGLHLDADTLTNQNGEEVDFFKWHADGGSMGSGNAVVLNTFPNDVNGLSKLGYWTRVSDSEFAMFVCESTPIIN